MTHDVLTLALLVTIIAGVIVVAILVFVDYIGNVNAVIGGPINCVENPRFNQHIHTFLHIYAGANHHAVTLPAKIGFINFLICSLHTHDQSGLIHIESLDATAKYTLGQFLDVWKRTQPATFVHVFGSLNYPISQYNNTILRDQATLNIIVNH